MKEPIGLNEFRAAYICAGPLVEDILGRWFGSTRVEPFPEKVKKVAADVADSNVNFAIVPYEPGYPPELAEKQHAFFKSFSSALLKENVETIALISAGPFSAEGEWKDSDWGAQLPGGSPAYHSKIAVMKTACWNNDKWREWIIKTAVDAVRDGAGGVCMDAPCFGASPLFVDGTFEGFAGCHCSKCRDLFAKRLADKSMSGGLPRKLGSLEDKLQLEYVLWRSGVVSTVLESVRDAIEKEDSSALFVVSAPHAGMLPSQAMFGLDPQWALSVPDVCIVEHNRAPAISSRGLWYESPNIKALNTIRKRTLIASLGYIYDMSSDSIPSPSRTSAAMAYPLSSCASPVIRYGEYRNAVKDRDPKIKWMLGETYVKQIEEAASINNWLDKNSDLFEGVSPAAEIGVLFSWKQLLENPSSDNVKLFYMITRTLTEVQVPVVAISLEEIENSNHEGFLKVLIVPESANLPESFYDWLNTGGKNLQVVYAGTKPSRAPEERSYEMPCSLFIEDNPDAGALLKSSIGKWFVRKVYSGQAALYGGLPLSARAGLPPLFLSKFKSFMCLYQPPSGWETIRKTVVEALEKAGSELTVEAPPYVHVQEWRKGNDIYYHCVNLLQGFPGPDHAVLKFNNGVSARVIDSSSGKITYHSNAKEIGVVPSPYTIVHVKGKNI